MPACVHGRTSGLALMLRAPAWLAPCAGDVLLFTTDPPGMAAKGSIKGGEVYTGRKGVGWGELAHSGGLGCAAGRRPILRGQGWRGCALRRSLHSSGWLALDG